MRLLAVLAALPLIGAAPSAPPPQPPARPAAPMPVSDPYAASGCPETPMSLARKQGRDLTIRNLGELPPAQTFMAVDRRVGGCPAPMLASERQR